MPSLLIQLTTVLVLSSRVASTCYFPNGAVSGSDTICNPNALVSACCYDNQACMSNGLCMSDPHEPAKARLHRGTCSDPTWKSGNCPRECTSVANNGVPVYSCNQTNTDSYCCFDNCKCNDNAYETFSFPSTDVYALTIIGEAFTQTHTSSASSATPSASTTSNSASILATTTAANSPSASASESPSSSSPSNSTAIGVGVGVGIAAVIIIGALVFFFMRRKKRNASKDTENPYSANPANSGNSKLISEMHNSENASPGYIPPAQKYAYYASTSQRASQGDQHAPVEMPTALHEPAELPASPAAGAGKEKGRL